MADWRPMEKRGSVGRGVKAVVASVMSLSAVLVSGRAVAQPASKSASNPAGSGTTTTSTTLPGIPKVPLTVTDGQSPQSLLTTALELTAVGLDTTALRTAISATQTKLDADASAAAKAQAAAGAAAARARTALHQAQAATARYDSMDQAAKEAVIYLYTSGPDSLTVNPGAGSAALFAQDYAESVLTPYGVLDTRKQAAAREKAALAAAKANQKAAARESATAEKALAAEQKESARLEQELTSVTSATARAVAADHTALAGQAGKELLSASSLQWTPKTPLPPPVSTTPIALAWAFAELGKPYLWGGTGPASFDCSGLTQFVWRAAGVSIPRVAADQDAWAIPVPLSDLLPGDLVFFGTTYIHHVGIYIGDGLMINAPHTGTVVQVSSIWWSDLAGFGRVHAPGTLIPLHQPPSAARPAPPAVVPSAGPVPSQSKPPPGWKPKPGETTPISLSGANPPGAATPPATTTTTVTPPTSTTTSEPAPATTTTTAPASTTTTSLGSSQS